MCVRERERCVRECCLHVARLQCQPIADTAKRGRTNILLKRVDCMKYLGVFFNSNLTFHEHIAFLCNKIAAVQGIVGSLRFSLPPGALRSIYFASCYTYLINHNLVWSGASVTLLNRVQVAQNKVLRLIYPDHNSTLEIYLLNNLLDVRAICEWRALLFFQKWSTGAAYSFLSMQINDFSFFHHHNLRNEHLLRVTFCRTERERRYVLCRAIRLHNQFILHQPL